MIRQVPALGKHPPPCPMCGEHHCVVTVTGSPGPHWGPAPSIRTPVLCEVMSRGGRLPGQPSLLQGPESWGCSGDALIPWGGGSRDSGRILAVKPDVSSFQPSVLRLPRGFALVT